MTSKLSTMHNLRTIDVSAGGRIVNIRFLAEVVETTRSGFFWRRKSVSRLRTIARDGWEGLWYFSDTRDPLPPLEASLLEADYFNTHQSQIDPPHISPPQ